MVPDAAHLQELQRLPHLLLHSQLNGEHRELERRQGEPARVADARLPPVGDALFQQHRVQVLHAPAADRQQRRRATETVISQQQQRDSREGWNTHLDAPKILWTSAWLYCPLLRLLSARRLLSIRDTSSIVSVPSGPVALSRSALIRCGAGFPWSALWYVSSPAPRQLLDTRSEDGRGTRTAEGRVVFDAVVRADVREVERVRPVVPLEHRRGVVRHVE